MPIQVTCPSCLTRFSVNEKFAGKKGPCPKCKSTIQVPHKDEQVVIHASSDTGVKDSKGRSVLKPIKRKELQVTRRALFVTLGVIAAAILLALGIRFVGESAQWIAILLGTLLAGPPLIWAGYSFSHNQELEPYIGSALRNRILILTGIYVLLWGAFAFIPTYVLELNRPSEMSLFVASFMFIFILGLGCGAAAVVFELEIIDGLSIAGAYFVGTLGLAYIAGIPMYGQPVDSQSPTRSVSVRSRGEAVTLQPVLSVTVPRASNQVTESRLNRVIFRRVQQVSHQPFRMGGRFLVASCGLFRETLPSQANSFDTKIGRTQIGFKSNGSRSNV